MSKGIEVLNLSNRAYNILKRNGIDTVEELMGTPAERLQLMRNLGVGTLKEIQTALAKYPYSLADEMFRELGYEKVVNNSSDIWYSKCVECAGQTDKRIIKISKMPLAKIVNVIWESDHRYDIFKFEEILACAQAIKEMEK